MIVISMLLVLVGFVTLMLGLFEAGPGDPLTYVYVTIGSCLAAGVFLVAGVLRSRPSKKPVRAGAGSDPSWAASTKTPGTPLERDEGPLTIPASALRRDTAQEPSAEPTPSPPRVAEAEASAPEPAAAESAGQAPTAETEPADAGATDDTDPRGMPTAVDPTAFQRPETDLADDEIVSVADRDDEADLASGDVDGTAAAREAVAAAQDEDEVPAEPAGSDPVVPARKAAKKSAKRAGAKKAAKKAGAKKATKKAAKKAGVKKATKKAAAKKTVKKAAAKKATRKATKKATKKAP